MDCNATPPYAFTTRTKNIYIFRGIQFRYKDENARISDEFILNVTAYVHIIEHNILYVRG